MSEYIAEVVQSQYGEATILKEKIIRCKDCKYWDDHWAGLNMTKCKAFDWRSKPDDFCSLAERKEE